jgi:starch phosphorylase
LYAPLSHSTHTTYRLRSDQLECSTTALLLHDRKAVYYLSPEFLIGRTLDNYLLSLGLKEQYTEGINRLGFNMKDFLAQERDAGLSNGSLGRLAACYIDSSASQELPMWGYGLRYK